MVDEFPEIRKNMSSRIKKFHLVPGTMILQIHSWSNHTENEDIKGKGKILKGNRRSEYLHRMKYQEAYP